MQLDAGSKTQEAASNLPFAQITTREALLMLALTAGSGPGLEMLLNGDTSCCPAGTSKQMATNLERELNGEVWLPCLCLVNEDMEAEERDDLQRHQKYSQYRTSYTETIFL